MRIKLTQRFRHLRHLKRRFDAESFFQVQKIEESRPSNAHQGIGLHDELDSFYSDIASIEATFNQNSSDAPEETASVSVTEDQQPKPPVAANVAPKLEEKVTKKKKKVSVAVSEERINYSIRRGVAKLGNNLLF